ncbi:hypothetical protein SCG7109_BN_00050, partial [Chlamydiales bacterium SCGC AG-110-M15]
LYAYVHNDPLRFIDYEGLYHRAIHSGSSFRTKQEEAIFYGAATGAASHTVRTGLSLVNLGAWTVGAKGIQRTLDGYDSYLSDPRNLNYAGFSHKHFSSGFTQGEYAAIGYESVMGGAGLLKAGKFALTKGSSLIRSAKTWRLDKNLLSLRKDIPSKYTKPGGGLDTGDFLTKHSQKHLFNPNIVSTKSRSQFGQNINVKALVDDTMSNPTLAYSDISSRITKYSKSYNFNISTPATPTGEIRVFINNTKLQRSSHFPYVTRNQG